MRSRPLTIIGLTLSFTLGVGCSTQPKPNAARDCAAFKEAGLPQPAFLGDANRVQIPTARRIGLSSPLESRRSPIPEQMVALKSIRGLRLRSMPSSRPWVVAPMAERLTDLVQRFHARLEKAGVPPYPLTVSSALRSLEEQRDLRTTNSNATQNSAHVYGTTIDIHYQDWGLRPRGWGHINKGFDLMRGKPVVWRLSQAWETSQHEREEALMCTHEALKTHLAATLAEMRAENLLWALEERAQPVFHITVR